MGISLCNSQLSLEDRMDLSFARAQREILSPRVIQKKDFYQKVRAACRELSLRNISFYEWDRELLRAWFTDGCVREKKLTTSRGMEADMRKDIGYIMKGNDSLSGNRVYTIRSFKINAFAFSDEAYSRFFRALEKYGLKPSQHHPFGTVFPQESEIKAWNERVPLYR